MRSMFSVASFTPGNLRSTLGQHKTRLSFNSGHSHCQVELKFLQLQVPCFSAVCILTTRELKRMFSMLRQAHGVNMHSLHAVWADAAKTRFIQQAYLLPRAL